MKKLLFFSIFILSIMILNAEEKKYVFNEILTEENIEPWWVKAPSPIDGMIGGVGISSEKKADERNKKAKQMAQVEIAQIKGTTRIESTVELKQTRDTSNMSLNSNQKTETEINAVLISQWEKKELFGKKTLYVWMAEFTDKSSYEKLNAYIEMKNKEFQNTKNFKDKIVIAEKKFPNRYIINAGKNKGIKKGDILEVFEFEQNIKNPSTGKYDIYTEKKKGELIVLDSYENTAKTKSSLLKSISLKENLVVRKTNRTVETEKKESKKNKFKSEYVPKIRMVENASALNNLNYLLNFDSDFDRKYSAELKLGLLDFFEIGVLSGKNEDYEKDDEYYNELSFKISLPLKIIDLGAMYTYNTQFETEKISYLINTGFLFMNFGIQYEQFLNKKDFEDLLGLSFSINPPLMENRIKFGGELRTISKEIFETDKNNEYTIKLDLKVLQNTWLGIGKAWESDEQKIFITVNHIASF